MSFIFGKGKKQSPTELTRSTKVAIAEIEEKLNSEEDIKRVKERVNENLLAMKFMLTGDQENEPKQEDIDRLSVDILEEHLIPLMVKNLKSFDFEAQKYASTVINFMLKKADQNNIVSYMGAHQEVLKTLVEGYNDPSSALNFGTMIRECCRHETLCSLILNSNYFYSFFDYVQNASFDIASDAFLSLKTILTKHKDIVAQFLQAHYDEFFEKYSALIKSENYVTKRQSLKLLQEILLSRSNFNIMIKYINDAENLKNAMILLRHKSKNIQFETFHIFKVFVANPEKSPAVLDILTRNKGKLIEYLENFMPDSQDENFVAEKKILLETLAGLPDP